MLLRKLMQYSLKPHNITGAKPDAQDAHFFMSSVYYNPFHGVSTIKYTLPENSWVKIKVFDKLGKEVLTLLNEFTSKGEHQIEFDTKLFEEGIYFYTIQAGEFKQARKLLLVC